MSKTFWPDQVPELLAWYKDHSKRNKVLKETVSQREVYLNVDIPLEVREEVIKSFCKTAVHLLEMRNEINTLGHV